MSATDPTGEGGGGGGEEGAMSTNVEQNASPSTPNTGTAVQATAQQQQQQQQHPPPSPLSGCYLLVVLPEPHTAQHKDLILNRLAKGFLSWDKDSCHVDLEKELLALVAQAPEGEEARNGERLIQYATENLVTEVLIHPQTNTLLQCIRNLLASFTKHRHIIHAGYTFGGNGSWILQDGTFSLADFLDAFSEHEVQRVLRAYENSVTVDIHCAGVGDWTTSRLSKEACCRFCRVRVNPDDVLTAGVPAITSFTNYIGQYLVPQTLDQLMEPSDVVGNIRFSHPTLYVFPGGQGDAALFGINGFNMLVDGGFARKACFWDFTRHLDRLDAVLVTRINNSNIGGMFSVLRKKKELHVYPQIGHFFCNLVERRQSNSPDGDKDIDPLILNLTDIGQEMVLNLRHINLRAHPCYRDSEPINLYHKVGHGTLDMYVLSPSKDSREVREFLSKWHASDSKLFAGSHKKDSNNLTFPIQNLVSICALLVWQPANPEDNITRILFPGSTPQHKIFEGFERLKHLDFLKHPVCSAKTLSPSTSLATLRDKPIKKFGLIEKESKKISEPKKREPSEPKSIKTADEAISKTTPQSTPIIPTSKSKTEMKTKKVAENKKIETEAKESKKIEKELKEIKKESKKELIKVDKLEKREEKDEIKKADLIKPESDKTAPKEIKEPKIKPEPKKKEAKESKTAIKAEPRKSEVTSKPKLSEKKARLSGAEKKDAVKSSPTTPKKTLNGTATKTEMSKAVPKTKPAPKVIPSLPAKSAKEANNRKVVEQKKSEVEKSAVKDTAAPVVKMSAKPKPTDRKPISRRTKPVSPSKARMPGSPAKSTRSTPTTSVKSDKDGVIRKVKGDRGTTDSSTVSTPSGIEPEAVKPIDKSLIEQSEDMSLDSIESKVLADLKEEREVVEEIEAVLQKAERIEETRKDDRFEGDDEITAEATDKKEEDITEEDVTAEIEDMPKKEGSRKESQELTEEDEYLIVEKEEVYTEDSAQSGEGEQKHVLDEAESEKAKILQDAEAIREKGEKEEPEEKGKDESPEKKIDEIANKDKKEVAGLSSEYKEQLQKEVKEIIASATEIVQKTEEKDDSPKRDSEDITKEPSSLSPEKLDSSEKKTTDTDIKPDVDQKEHILEKMEESQERISTIESGATTTAPTLPEDERIPLDEIKEDIDEKHVIEEVKEKDAPTKQREEVVPETVPAIAKPEVKVFDVRQAMQNLQRDIVKTPDEVADLPVHEEVDPKLYRMEDFEKGKEEKPSPTTQEIKDLPTPPVKEQKGVFSFFGKVADKFEKGIDKLTKKSKKESDKDSDEKSSSKSSSPKEAKVQEKTLFEEVDVEKMFPKVGKPADKPEMFEKMKPTIVDVKVAAIKETASFIQEEILDAQRKSVSDIEEKLPTDKLEEIKKAETEIEEALLAKDVLSKPIDDQDIAKEIELLKEEDIGEDAEDVKALLVEASKKFKTVKDSLRDSLESLEEKVKEEEIGEMEHDILKDTVKDTLEGVAEKLEEMKPHIESHSLDIKEPEKVKFAIPKDEEFEEEYEEEPEGPYRDMKEAVRDVGEVLAGTAGIILEDKPKDVIEIVKKVAEVLKEDDFLSDKQLFDQASKKEEILSIPDRKPSKEEISSISTERKLSVPSEKISPEKDTKLEESESKLAHEDVTPTKVGITEVFPVHEEVEELVEKPGKLLAPCEKPGTVEVKEEPCVKMIKIKDDTLTSPVKDTTKDKKDAQKICAEMLKDDQHICDQHKKPADDDTCQEDVLQAGIESICVKEIAKRPSLDDKLKESDIEHPVISFEQKVSPAKAEIVMVTPGSTPTSPKFTADKMYDKELEIGLQELSKLPEDIKQILSKEAPVEEVIEELIITKKKKITIEVIEYITVVKRIPKERVIYIIEEIIVKKGLPRESVVDDPEILKLKESITPEKRMEVEDYIVNEYIVKEKRITIDIVEEISIKKVVPKKIVIEIIEEIIVRRKIARHMVLDIPEEVLSKIITEKSPEESPEESAEEQITPKIDITAKRESIAEVSSAPTKEEEEPIISRKRAEIEEFVVNEYVIKEKKITASIIDEISAKKDVPKKILIEIIEEIIIKKKIPRNVLLDVSEEDLLEISTIHKTTPEDEEKKKISEKETEALNEKQKSIIEVPSIPEIPETKELVTPQERAEVEEYIVKEYITKGDSINIQKLEEICGKKNMPKKIIIEIIEEIIIKRKLPRHMVLGVTEEELSRIIKEEETPEPEVLAEKRKSVAEVLSPDEKKKPVELEKDKKEDVPEHEISEEELSPFEEEDVEEEEEEVDGFVSIPRKSFDEMKKAISPIKTEVLPVAAKEHEKDVIDDFEAVEQEYKVRDVPITSPEKADEMKEKEDIEETAEDIISEVIEADEKFVQETKEKVGKEEPRIDVAKDIKPDDKKREPEEPETSEISEIVDTTEKYLDEAKEKTDDVSPKEKSLIEKADELKEFKEKEMPIDVSDKRSSIDVAAVPEVISKSITPSTKLIDEKAATDEAKKIEPAIKEKVKDLITKDDKSKPTTPIKDETLKDIIPSIEKLPEKDVEKVEPETKLADVTGFAQETKTELLEDDKKSKSLETTEIKETPITKDEKSPQELPEEALSKKLSISKEPEDEVLEAKDKPHVEDVTKPLEKIKDEKLPEDKLVKEEEDIGTVKRMLVTACSEDGREEIEICPTGSITFMKTVTPDDSLKDVSVKSTPDKDSLLLDKDSLHSGVSTPEKDSISEKSVPEGKDKITPEDSLEKSPIGTRDSQDLEDSLEKLELHKPKDVKIPSIDDDKPKVPEKSEITKPKSPMEKEDLKVPDKIAEKDALQSPEEREEPKSLAKDAGEIEKMKSPTEEIVEKIPKSPTKDIEKVEKSKSPSPSAEKSLIESAEKTTLPIEKALSPEKEGTASVSKTPESLRSEDVSPAETIFSKSPTDKPEMYFTKIPISEEEIAPETVTEKLSESVKEIKPIEDKELAMSKEKTPSPESKERISKELETKESDLKPISPVIATSALDEKTPFEKSRSSSISSEKHEEKDVLSTSSEKSEDKESSIRSKSPSIVSDKEEKEGAIDKSRLSSIVSESVDKKISETEEKAEEKEPMDKFKSPSIVSEKSEQDIKSPDKLFSVISDKAEEKETDKPKSPGAIEKETISEKSPILESEYFDEKGPIDEARSSSAISDRSDERKEAERSKSPSIAADKPDLQDVMESYLEKQKSPIFDRPESPKDIDKTEEQDKNRSPSVASDKSDKKVSSRSPSISVEKIDLKDMDLSIERARSPSVMSDKDDKLEQLPVSKSLIDKTEIPKDAQKSPKLETGLKDIMQPPLDKSRSSSVTSTISESKESVLKEKSPTGEFIDKSKSPSPVEQKLDIGEKEPSEKSRSSSIVAEQSIPEEIQKSPSLVGEKLEDLSQEPIEKSRSPSVSSIVTDKKELVDRSKSPSIIDEKSDLKDVAEQLHDKSRSPSVISVTGEQKEPIDLSKSPSIAGEKSDSKDVIDIPDKSRSSSIASVTDAHKESADRSKSPSIAAEKPDIKDVTETVTDKSRSPSVISVAEEQKEPLDRSKSPSVIDEKPDLKDVVEQLDGKSRSPSATSDLKEPEERSKSPSIAEDKSDEKESTADKSRSASVVSITSEQKETTDRSKSPSVVDEKPDLKDVAEQHIEKLSSDKSDDKKSLGDSKASSIAGDKSDLTDITEHPIDKSKSPSIASITSEQKEPTEKEKSFSDKKEDFDRSKSPSVASEKSEEAKSVVGSKASSIAGDTMDLKDISEPPIDKSPSPSVISVTTDQKEPIEEPVSPQQIKEPHDRSKSPSVASEKSGSRTTSITEDKPDFKDIMEPPADKSRSSSVASFTTEKAEPSGKSISPVSDKLEPPVDRSKSPSTASDKSDEKVSSDSKVGSKEYYEDATDKSPNLIDAKSSTVLGKLDIKSDDVIPDDKAQSSSVVLDKLPIEKIDIDGLKTCIVTDEQDLIDKTRSLSIISDKTEPKSSSDVSKSPSLADDKISPSLDIGKISKDESAKSSRASSPLDKTSKDRSQSVFDIGDTIPASRSRTASLFDDKLPEKVLPQDAAFKHIDTEKLLDEKDENKDLPKEKSPATSPEMIQKEMRKIREKRFADFGEPDTTQPSTIEKSDDEEENIVKVTAEKKAEIEKYILEEFIARKKKISLIVIEKLVMTYSVPQFVVMEIIEDIISRENVPRSAVFDFVDDESSESQYEKEMALLPPQKKADVEKYINEEFIAKKKKITPETLEEIVILKGLPRYIIITIIEEIIMTKCIPKNTVIEGDLDELREKSSDIIEKEDKPIVPTDMNLKKASITQDREKPSDTTRSESPDGKMSSADSARNAKALSASPSLSPEPIPSDRSTQDSPARSEPHIDEEISISEEKRTEIEKLLEEEYIKKGRKITEVILEEIIIRTSLPKYIILEIVEEIILKRKIPRESVIDVEIYQEEEPEEDYDKAVYRYDRMADAGYELPHETARKSSVEYRMSGMYSESGERQLDKPDYPMDYESQFHKAFVGGMTEMRTTHITTLSGKSTPEFATHDATPESGIETADKAPDKLSESTTLTTTHITDVEDPKTVQPVQTVTILRESKITEPHLPAESPEKHDAKHEIIDKDESEKHDAKHEIISKDESEKHDAKHEIIGKDESEKHDAKHEIIGKDESETETAEISKEDQSDVIKKIVKREVFEQAEPATESDSDVTVVKKIIKREIVEPQEESVEVKETKRPSVQQDEPEAITKIIKREIVEHDEPEVVTKVIKREIIEQDEPEIITKVIKREIVVPDEGTSDSTQDSGEYVKTITTKTTRTIVTEELPDAELSQTDPSKIYTDPTSGTTYRVVSDESAPDATTSADVKRIVTTVTTITGPDGKVTTKKDVKESTDTVDSEKLLEKLIDSGKIATETAKSTEEIIKETITTVTSDTSTPDAKILYDSGKSTPDLKQEDKFESTAKERLGADKFEHSVSPLVRDLISDDKSYSGKSSPDISLPKDIVFSGSTGKSTPEIPMSPLIRDGAAIQSHLSGRSTPDRRSDGRSSTGTPEGFRSGEVIRTTITTTKMISDEGEIVTTTREVTETTNEKGETFVLAEKTDVKVDDRLPSKEATESAISSIIGGIKSTESPQHSDSLASDEPPSSPLSSTSQVGYSPETARRYEPSSDKEGEQKEQQIEFSAAAMSSSFYGELPAVPAQISAMKTFQGETGVQKSSDHFMVEKEFAGGYGEKPDAKRYVDEADLDFDKALMERKEMKEANGAFSSGVAPRYTNGSLRHETDDAKDHPSSSFRDDKDDSKGDSKKDPLEGWGTPLGLPSPKPPRKFNLKSPAQASCSSESTSDTLNFDVLKDWGEPLRLPSPAPATNEISNKGAPGTPKKERKQAKKVQSENIKNKKRSESPGKNEKKLKDSKNKIQPVYMDLAYVPHHGNSYYTSLEFFKRVRARYYVFSGTEPSREVYDALLEAKKTWEDKDLEVTMIPTYDTDTLGYWVADNEEALAANHIDLSPSASRCTINLQDHETSCSAYRLEF